MRYCIICLDELICTQLNYTPKWDSYFGNTTAKTVYKHINNLHGCRSLECSEFLAEINDTFASPYRIVTKLTKVIALKLYEKDTEQYDIAHRLKKEFIT